MIDYAAARLNMVEGQLRTNKVTDEALLDAFLSVPRELYVSDGLRRSAYVDDDLPLSGGGFLMQPMVLARLLQAAAVEPGAKALVIGDTTGYVTALLTHIGALVTAGTPQQGNGAGAPYQVIVLAGAVPEIPAAVSAQLAEGGRLVGVLRAGDEPGDGMGQGFLMMRAEGALSHRPLFDAGTPYLVGCKRVPSFVF